MYGRVNFFLKIILELNVKSSSLFSKYEVKKQVQVMFSEWKFKNPSPSSCAFKNTCKDARFSLGHSYDFVRFFGKKNSQNEEG